MRSPAMRGNRSGPRRVPRGRWAIIDSVQCGCAVGQRSRLEIIEWLRQEHGLRVIGFDDPEVELEVVREYARAVHDMRTMYPGILLEEIAIDDLPDDHFGLADTDEDGKYTGRIIFSRRSATDPATFRREIAEGIASGEFTPAYRARPVYAVVVHELFHDLVAAGEDRARIDADRVLLEQYAKSTGMHPVLGLVGFYAWSRRLGSYSFLDEDEGQVPVGELKNREAVADAGLDVMMFGTAAPEPAKILFRATVEAAARVRDGGDAPGIRGEVCLSPGRMTSGTDESNGVLDDTDGYLAEQWLWSRRRQLVDEAGVEGISDRVGMVSSGSRRFIVLGVAGESEAQLTARAAAALNAGTDPLVRDVLHSGEVVVYFEWVSESGWVISRRGSARVVDGAVRGHRRGRRSDIAGSVRFVTRERRSRGLDR